LSWASANFDESVFQNPEIIKIDRKPNPHVAFGNGPHNCLGAPHARLLIRKFISVLIQKVSKVSLLSCELKTEKTKDYQRVNGYEHLKLCFFKK
jgi:cytochrome P450